MVLLARAANLLTWITTHHHNPIGCQALFHTFARLTIIKAPHVRCQLSLSCRQVTASLPFPQQSPPRHCHMWGTSTTSSSMGFMASLLLWNVSHALRVILAPKIGPVSVVFFGALRAQRYPVSCFIHKLRVLAIANRVDPFAMRALALHDFASLSDCGPSNTARARKTTPGTRSGTG